MVCVRKKEVDQMRKLSENSLRNQNNRHPKLTDRAGSGALTLAGGALLDVEQLVEAQSLLVPSQALLVQLQLPQTLVLLVASGAGVLHQVEAGLGGVVAQRAVVDTRLQAVRAVLLLQVLWNTREEGADVRWSSCFTASCGKIQGSYCSRSCICFLF